MKLLIVGSRDITDIDISKYIPEDVELIISGGAAGVDTLAEKYADEHRISKLILRPNYRFFGKGAPIKRNRAMVDLADSVLNALGSAAAALPGILQGKGALHAQLNVFSQRINTDGQSCQHLGSRQKRMHTHAAQHDHSACFEQCLR